MDTLIQQLDIARLVNQVVDFIPRVVTALLVLAVFVGVFRLTRGSLVALLQRAELHPTLIRMLVDNIYRITILVFGLVMAADQIGINVGAALAGIGVAGIAIGFAAQDSLANVISSFLIFFDKPFEVGDWVRVADQYGQISDITMRSTRIRTKRNTYVVIPNKTIVDAVLVNYSKHGVTRVDVPVGIAYKENMAQAREVMLGAVREIKDVLTSPPPDLVVTELGASSVNMNVRVWIDDAGKEQPVFFKVMETCKQALDDAGIEIPYHHLQVFVEKIEERVWQKASQLLSVTPPSGEIADVN